MFEPQNGGFQKSGVRTISTKNQYTNGATWQELSSPTNAKPINQLSLIDEDAAYVQIDRHLGKEPACLIVPLLKPANYLATALKLQQMRDSKIIQHCFPVSYLSIFSMTEPLMI